MYDPVEMLYRIVRRAGLDSAVYRTGKIRALSAVSAVASAAASRPARRPSKGATPRAAPTPLSEDTTAAVVRFRAADAELVIRTMIAAAAADGEIDVSEARRIVTYLRDSGGTPAKLAFAERETERPAAPEALAQAVVSRETAVELYAAALLVTAATTPGTREFLARLARALKLDPQFVAGLHTGWGDPPPLAE